MAMERKWGKMKSLSEINVTPLVDVALTLLIVFMITAPLLQQGLPVNLPEASAPALKRAKEDIILTVQNNGAIYIGDDKIMIPMDEIEGRLSAIFSQRQQKDLFIKADTDLRYGDVIRIMSIAKKAGVDRIGMITQPEKGNSL
ncbi:MAG TPA: biopolymer transporter ExbD [bacterium]|nr:biopolymer transporter ExbD [Myxococcales bacterium]OQA60348.1 MAG: Biopolymer transport protein ExbD [bacterium ADurb.Bin270]HPW45304.1 biopolymer transporter ExbD [bacterium]HQG13515.1 biopolymer transporter ExbD [bacterium]